MLAGSGHAVCASRVRSLHSHFYCSLGSVYIAFEAATSPCAC